MKTVKWIGSIAISLSLLSCSNNDHEKLQGYLEGCYLYVSSYTTGYLKELKVKRGESVKQGQVLFVIDSAPESWNAATAVATAKAEQATLADMQLGERAPEIKAIEEEVQAATATAVNSKKNYQRQLRLYQQNSIGQSQLDDAKSTYLRDTALLKQLQAQLVSAQLGAREHRQQAQQAKIEAAQAAVHKANWLLTTKTVKAAKSGRVENTFYQQGELVTAQQPVLSLLPPGKIRVIFYIPEPKLGSLKIGDQIKFDCDSCAAGTATITYISSKAEYTPPVLYTQHARQELVYQVKATVSAEKALSYHPGQPVDITLPASKGSA